MPAIPEKGDVTKILRDQQKTLVRGDRRKNANAASHSRLGIESELARGRYQNQPLTASSDVGSKIDQKEKLISMVK